MSRPARWLIEALLVVAVVAAVSLWHKRDVVSGLAPPLAGVLADDRPFRLDDWRRQHPGRPVVLHFWAEWCAICKTVEGSVDAIGRDWPLLTVAMQSGGGDAVARHLSGRGLAWATVVDADGALARSFGLHGVPAFVVIDADGRIRFVELGYTSEIGMRLRLWWAARGG